MVPPVQEPNLTSQPYCNNDHTQPKPKLGDGEEGKATRDERVFHCHGMQPATAFSGTNSEPLIIKRNYSPDGQHDLGEKGTTNKQNKRVPRGFIASIFVEREKGGETTDPQLSPVHLGHGGHRTHTLSKGPLWYRVEWNSLVCQVAIPEHMPLFCEK